MYSTLIRIFHLFSPAGIFSYSQQTCSTKLHLCLLGLISFCPFFWISSPILSWIISLSLMILSIQNHPSNLLPYAEVDIYYFTSTASMIGECLRQGDRPCLPVTGMFLQGFVSYRSSWSPLVWPPEPAATMPSGPLGTPL